MIGSRCAPDEGTALLQEHDFTDFAQGMWQWASPLQGHWDCKEIQPVHSEGDQPWDFFGRNDAKAETPVLWPPHAKS